MDTIDRDALAATLADEARRAGNRRRFLTTAARAGVAAGGLSLLAACGGGDDDSTTTPTPTPSPTPTPTPSATGTFTPVDADALIYALNLFYLQAQFYARATTGTGLADTVLTGSGTKGAVAGGAQVPFSDPIVAQYARELAAEKLAHVNFARGQLGNAVIAQPAINIDGGDTGAFTTAARLAGIITATQTFNPYASDANFLISAFLFEDVAVTVLKGASVIFANPTTLEAAAGLIAANAYHAGMLRSVLYRKGIYDFPNRLSNARDLLDGTTDLDEGVGNANRANIVPADPNTAVAYSRSTGQGLNILYLNAGAVVGGGFFPAGFNGRIRTSAANSTPAPTPTSALAR